MWASKGFSTSCESSAVPRGPGISSIANGNKLLGILLITTLTSLYSGLFSF